MKHLICFFILFCFVNVCPAQTLLVIDEESKAPIAFASLSAAKSNAYTSTNEDGLADLSNFLEADSIEIRYIGYESIFISYQALKALNFKLELRSKIFSLDQMVVSATRWQQQRVDIPGRLTKLDAKLIQLQQPQTAADLLNNSGEVFIQKSQMGGGSPMIRGFSANRLLYTIDGIRMNSAIFRSGNLHNVIAIDPLSIANTEILFGPGSIIYGSDALGAVMSFQSLSPQLSNSEKLLFKGNSLTRSSSANEELTGHLDFNIGTKKWAFLSSITGNLFGDLKMGSVGPAEYLRSSHVIQKDNKDYIIPIRDPRIQVPTSYDQINLLQKIRYQPNEHWNLEYGFYFSKTTDIPRYDRLIQTRENIPRSAEWYYGPQKWQMNKLFLSHNKHTSLYNGMNLRIAQQRFEESRINRAFEGTERIYQLEKVDAYSINLDLYKNISKHFQLFYGVESIYNKVASSGFLEDINTEQVQKGASRYPQADWYSHATYASLKYEPKASFLIQAGLRFNTFLLNADFSNNLDFFPLPQAAAKLKHSALTGSLGMVAKLSPSFVLNANLSTGFRAANVDDIGKVFDSEPGAVVVPNTSLTPEYAYNFELGLNKIFEQELRLDISAYYTILDKAMVRNDFQLNGRDSILYQNTLSRVQAVQNIGRAYVYGFQLGVELPLFPKLHLIGNFNFQKGKEALEEDMLSPARHVAPFFGLVKLKYQKDGLSLETNIQYSGAINYENLSPNERVKVHLYALDELGRPFSPSWYTLNFKSNLRIKKQFMLGLGVENITDQRYRSYSSGIAAAGRNLVLSLGAKF